VNYYFFQEKVYSTGANLNQHNFGLIHLQLILAIVFWFIRVVFGKLQTGSISWKVEFPFFYPSMHIIHVQCLSVGGLMKL